MKNITVYTKLTTNTGLYRISRIVPSKEIGQETDFFNVVILLLRAKGIPLEESNDACFAYTFGFSF